MPNKILLNNQEFHFKEGDLPCFVHYREKEGGTHFTISLVADLCLQGSKLLFLTAYPMARDNFLEQVTGMESQIILVESKEALIEAQDYQVIMLKSGDTDLYIEALKTLTDISERVVLVKNFEVFDTSVITESLKLEKIVLSGDIDKSVAKNQIGEKSFKTTVTFSEPETPLTFQVPVLDKYIGFLKTADKEGLISIQM